MQFTDNFLMRTTFDFLYQHILILSIKDKIKSCNSSRDILMLLNYLLASFGYVV